MDGQDSLYEELRETLRFRDDLRYHGIIDTGLFLGEKDRLYRNRPPKGIGKHTIIKIRKGNFTIEGVVPESRSNMIDLIKQDGVEVHVEVHTGVNYG